MNRQITRVAVVALILLASLILATTYWQAYAAPDLADRQDNSIQRVAQFTVKRGELTTVRLTADKPGVSGSAAGSTSHRWSAS